MILNISPKHYPKYFRNQEKCNEFRSKVQNKSQMHEETFSEIFSTKPEKVNHRYIENSFTEQTNNLFINGATYI